MRRTWATYVRALKAAEGRCDAAESSAAVGYGIGGAVGVTETGPDPGTGAAPDTGTDTDPGTDADPGTAPDTDSNAEAAPDVGAAPASAGASHTHVFPPGASGSSMSFCFRPPHADALGSGRPNADARSGATIL